jgi:hypothetical protein
MNATFGFSRFQALLPGDGRAAVAWAGQDVSEGDATSPFTARIALAGATRRFGRAAPLVGTSVGRPQIVSQAGGDTVLTALAELAVDAASGAAFATWRDVGAPVAWSVRTSIG